MGTHYLTRICHKNNSSRSIRELASREFKIACVFITVLLSCWCAVFGAGCSRPATEESDAILSFRSPRQENAFNAFQICQRGCIKTPEEIFTNCNSMGNTEWANGIRRNLEGIEASLDRPQLESFFGEKYFRMFMQYQKDATDGICKFMTKDFTGARASLKKAKADAKKLKRLPMKNKGCFSPLYVEKLYLEIVVCLGVTECLRKNVNTGMAALRAARDEASRAKWHWGEAQAAYCIAHCAEWAKLPSAGALYQEALDMARANRIHHYVWKCCLRLAAIHFREGAPESAISLLEEAITSIEFLRTKMESDADRVLSVGRSLEVYQWLLKALIETNQIRKALEVSENTKSRILQDLLDSTRTLKLWGAGHDSLLTQEQVLSEKIEDVENMQGKDSGTRLALLRKAHDNVVAQIRKDNPDFGMIKAGGSADADEIQGLLDKNTVLLEYYTTWEYLFVWLVTKDSITGKKIPLDTPALTQKIKAIRMMMGKPKTPAVTKLLGQLYDGILQPFEKEIQERNLIIVPDGILHYLPFAALVDREGKFLVEKHTICLEPTFTALKFCMDRRKGRSKTVLAFGDPDLQDAKLDLPNARLEVKNIAKIFPQAQVYLRDKATETLAKKIMGNFDIIHFACHGEMDPACGVQSCLRLAPDAVNDGKLTAGEIFELRLNAQLVILSGCETGVSELCPGDELIGMTRSFLYAGTPSMIVSLWKVDDDATSLLMSNLYKNLATMGKAEALRQAQIATMKVKRHPYYWAAFYLVGDGR